MKGLNQKEQIVTTIRSMTAYSRQQETENWGTAVLEIRSVNHRFLEVGIKLPENLREIEHNMRQLVQEKLSRGKVDISVRYMPGDAINVDVHVNRNYAERLVAACNVLSENHSQSAPISMTDILRWPGVTETTDEDVDIVFGPLLKLLEVGLDRIELMREEEGARLQGFLEQRLNAIAAEVEQIKARLPNIISGEREKLHARLDELQSQVDPARLEQEILIFSQKIDVSEEIDRLDAHVAGVRDVLKEGGSIGRRLDFYMQEMNREANTIGSKSADVDTTKHAIELKVLIEQMREQVQNIE